MALTAAERRRELDREEETTRVQLLGRTETLALDIGKRVIGGLSDDLFESACRTIRVAGGARTGKRFNPDHLLTLRRFAPATDALSVAFTSAFLAGTRRETNRARERGLKVDIPDEPFKRAVQRGKRAAEQDARDFAEPTFATRIVQGAPPFVEPVEAIEFMRNLVPLKSATVASLVRNARRNGISASATFLGDLRALAAESVREVVAEGLSLTAAERQLRRDFESFGLSGVNPHRLETILRNGVNTAYTAGRLELLKDPDIRAAMPFLIYRTMEDSAVRPTHVVMNDKAYRHEHPIWRVWLPPNGHN